MYTFYKKCPYKILEHDIYTLGNEGSILLLGYFNVRTTTNQVILLSNDSNHNPQWLDEDLVLANIYKRNSSNNVMDYMISYISTYNQIVNFDILNNHDIWIF